MVNNMSIIIPIRQHLLRVAGAWPFQWTEHGRVIAINTYQLHPYGRTQRVPLMIVLADASSGYDYEAVDYVDSIVALLRNQDIPVWDAVWYERFQNLVWSIDFDGPGYRNPWKTGIPRSEAREIVAAINGFDPHWRQSA